MSLLSDNLVSETGQKDNKKGQIEIFDFMHQLINKVDFFEVRYNDENLPQIQDRIKEFLV